MTKKEMQHWIDTGGKEGSIVKQQSPGRPPHKYMLVSKAGDLIVLELVGGLGLLIYEQTDVNSLLSASDMYVLERIGGESTPLTWEQSVRRRTDDNLRKIFS